MSSSMEDFSTSVEEGLNLSKRIYYGNERLATPPTPNLTMSKTISKSTPYYLPKAPMVYAVVEDPGIVDNPDVPSYQPYVHGKLEPPALIPLLMLGVGLEVECYLDTVFVRVKGRWRVHCVKGSRCCDCRIVVPMGEQGSILGVEVDIPRKSYHTQLIEMENKPSAENAFEIGSGVFLKPGVFMLTIPQVHGGTNLSINLSWSQKLMYQDGEFSLCIPFSFPDFVSAPSKKIPKREKIELSVHPGDGNEVLCKNFSHPLKDQQTEKLSFLYELDVFTWSSTDFSFTYSVLASHIVGNVIVGSPSTKDNDQREMLYIHIVTGSEKSKKVFSKRIVYVIDISGSMEGNPVDYTKNALSSALQQLNPEDSFNIIGFNEKTFLFSSSLRFASKETIEDAIQWISINFVAGEGTNICLALDQAMGMLPDSSDSLPMIFLITDGSVEDERQICDTAKNRLSHMKSTCLRIHTFGIGSYCNHYFLRMLAMIGGGHYDAAYDEDVIESRLLKLMHSASSTVLANITFDALEELKDVEVHSTRVPDLSLESPLIISGRYIGKFPKVLKARGVLADLTNFEMEMRVQEAEEFPIGRLSAMHQISMCTAQAWLSEDKEIEIKVARMSIRNSIFSEYVSMALLMTDTLKKEADPSPPKQKKTKTKTKTKTKPEATKEEPKPKRVNKYRNLGVGFGDTKATAENTPPGLVEPRPLDGAEMIAQAASNCCNKICKYCCCSCCINACSKMNNQCTIVLTQICGALACCGCLRCCHDCCSENQV